MKESQTDRQTDRWEVTHRSRTYTSDPLHLASYEKVKVGVTQYVPGQIVRHWV